jgi:putative Mg2+ transporter-C (MgtC) family protein
MARHPSRRGGRCQRAGEVLVIAARGWFAASMQSGGFDMPSVTQFGSAALRLVVAAALGGALGFEREIYKKSAGLRTHMLVALGAALFVIASLQSGASPGDVTRVVQGIATGIGFVGAGAILKGSDTGEVKGLTTATGIWLTAAVGVAVGAGQIWLPVLGVILALIILSVLKGLEKRLDSRLASRRAARRG